MVPCPRLIWRFVLIGVAVALSGLILTGAATQGSAHDASQDLLTVDARLERESVTQGESSRLILTVTGIVSRQFAEALIRRLSGEVDVVSRLAEARVLA